MFTAVSFNYFVLSPFFTDVVSDVFEPFEMRCLLFFCFKTNERFFVLHYWPNIAKLNRT